MKILKRIKLYFERNNMCNLILKSDLFDSDWYLRQYPEVLSKNVNPVRHYLEQGWKEGKNPSALFCNDAYLSVYGDVRMSDMNPLVHYIKYGKDEKRDIFSVAMAEKYQLKESDMLFVKKAHKESKTILLISHELSLTGAPRALLNMAIALKEQSATPIILSLRNGQLEKEIIDSGIKYVVEIFLDHKVKHGDKLWECFLHEFDIVLFNTLDTVRLVEYFSSYSGKKTCWLHEGAVSYDFWRRHLNLTSLFSRFDKIFVVGKYSESFVSTHVLDQNKIEILLYGISDMKRSTVNIGNNDKVHFLLPGTLTVRKGQPVLIKSLGLLSEKIREKIMICFVGSANEKEVLEAIERCPYSCVKYLGEFTHEYLMELFGNMDVILVPSLDDPMPIVCTEAMILEKAFVVSENTGTARFIENGVNGYKIPANSPEALAKTIEFIVGNKECLLNVGKAARRIYDENFTMAIFEKNVKTLILED